MVRAATAVFGAAVAIGIAPLLQFRAAPGELPGALPADRLSPAGPVVQFSALLLFIIAFAIVGNVAARYLNGIRWATISYCAALFASPLPLMHFGNLRHVLLHGVVATGIVLARKLNPRFSRDDVVLLPVFLATYFAFLDIEFGKTAIATFERAAIAVFVLRLLVRRPLAFAAAPLAFLFEINGHGGWLALIWIIATPLIASRIHRERLTARLLALVIYPIALTAYSLALVGIDSPPLIDFFEDGHDFLVASEMARGERPYVEVLPTHGFLSDGGLDFVFMKSGADTIGKVLRARRVIAALNLAAIYFVALAASGSSAAGCLAVLLGFALFPASTFFLRSIPALLCLAVLATAVRLRSNRWLIAGGALLALALLTSVDFAAYTGVVALILILRWPQCLRAARSVAIGFFGVLIPALLLFAIGGFAIAFFTGTFDIVRSGRVFVSGPLAIPDCLRSLSAMIWQLPNPRCLSAVLWLVAIIISAAAFARSPLRTRRGDAIWYVGLWVAIAGLAWIERQHGYYEFALAAFVVAVLFRFRRHPAAIAVAIAIVLLARPLAHIFDLATPLRRSHGLRPAGWVEFRSLPRARDAVMLPRTAAALASMQRFMTSQLRPSETFFDFTYAALLYYLFNRNCPIPHAGVPFYESESAQKDVIATLQRDPSIRAVVIEFPDGLGIIDGVPNRMRAPLVWSYIENNFSPAFAENGVAIWKRREADH